MGEVKILFNCHLPFSLAHGGHAVQIEQTMAALTGLGVAVETLRGWDQQQTGDLIHFIGRMPAEQIRLAHEKKIKVVMAELLTGPGSRSPGQLRRQKMLTRAIARLAPRSFVAAFNWDSYRLADGLIALTAWEKQLMSYLFEADPEKIAVVPNGVEEVFFRSPATARGEWLVCTATITKRKRTLELAQAAVAARTPTWIIGRAYSDNDPYAQQFFQLARANPQWIRYEGGINDRVRLAAIYRAARGFVLLSTMESLSLSALEAAAADCPLLLSDLPWARTSFPSGAAFCPDTDATPVLAGALRTFYDAAPTLPRPPQPATWPEVAQQFKGIYETILGA